MKFNIISLGIALIIIESIFAYAGKTDMAILGTMCLSVFGFYVFMNIFDERFKIK